MNTTETGQPLAVLSSEGLGVLLAGAKERRTIWSHLQGAPFAIRRFTTRPPLVDGAAYGVEMIERRKVPDRRSPAHRSDDMTGLCTVRDAAAIMLKVKTAVCEMYFHHEGKKWNVEIRILRAEDEPKTPNVGAERPQTAAQQPEYVQNETAVCGHFERRVRPGGGEA